MYGVGECMVGSINLAAPILLAELGGVYIAFAAVIFVVVPALLLAWWLDSRRNDGAA